MNIYDFRASSEMPLNERINKIRCVFNADISHPVIHVESLDSFYQEYLDRMKKNNFDDIQSIETLAISLLRKHPSSQMWIFEEGSIVIGSILASKMQ